MQNILFVAKMQYKTEKNMLCEIKTMLPANLYERQPESKRTSLNTQTYNFCKSHQSNMHKQQDTVYA